MTINTKYNVGDQVWLMTNNRITQAQVTDILVSPYNNNINYPIEVYIKYYLRNSLGRMGTITKQTEFSQKQLFPSKKELLESL